MPPVEIPGYYYGETTHLVDLGLGVKVI